MRCHYCKEFGHFVREYLKRSKDEKIFRNFSGMRSGNFAAEQHSEWDNANDEWDG